MIENLEYVNKVQRLKCQRNEDLQMDTFYNNRMQAGMEDLAGTMSFTPVAESCTSYCKRVIALNICNKTYQSKQM
jgi:hypothetical protein